MLKTSLNPKIMVNLVVTPFVPREKMSPHNVINTSTLTLTKISQELITSCPNTTSYPRCPLPPLGVIGPIYLPLITFEPRPVSPCFPWAPSPLFHIRESNLMTIFVQNLNLLRWAFKTDLFLGE